MARDLLAGRLGVDAVAFVSMSAALLLGEPLAGAVVAVMYAGGNLLEDFAVARAERDLKSLVDRAPRVAHRRIDTLIEDVAIDQVAIGDTILVRAGEVIPVDGLILGGNATLDEAALTGEPIPVTRNKGDPVHSGTLNAGETFELRASASAGESTYAGIVRMVTAAQTAKAPFIRLADRYALILLPVPAITSSTAPGSTSVRSNNPRQPAAPRSTGCTPDSPPFRLPTAVRTASMTYASGITQLLLW
jgi:cation transport ATPase